MPRSRGRPARCGPPGAWIVALVAACSGRPVHERRVVEAHEDHGDDEHVRVAAGRVTVRDGREGVAPFRVDRTLVTRARFESFVDATGHVTDAERVGDGQVLDLASGLWRVERGATFRMPRGPRGEPAASDHPVTQVTLTDAQAYCAWAGGRVPTELEWELAARNGRDDRTAYPWGDDAYPEGRARANTWEGVFPSANTLRDGHLFVSPVDAFPPSPIGLRDIVGNVWHWTTSAFDASATEGDVALRGGSHLCDPDVCHGFRIDARQRAVRTDRFAHVGFRCVYDVSASSP